MTRTTLVGALAALVFACGASACADSPRGTVTVGDVVIEPSHACRIGISGTFTATTADAIVGVTGTFGSVSLHPLVGGPAVGGHEGHLDNGGKRVTRAVTSVALAKGVTTLRAHDLAMMIDRGAAAVAGRPSVAVTFRFRNSPPVTVDATVRLGSCG